MIGILKNGGCYTIHNVLVKEWLNWQGLTEDKLPDGIQFAIDDDHPLAAKVFDAQLLCKFVIGEDGNLIDVIPLPRPDSVPEQSDPITALTAENELLKQQITDLQLAVCDIYEAVTATGTEAGR